jgi:hypothetical protein
MKFHVTQSSLLGDVMILSMSCDLCAFGIDSNKSSSRMEYVCGLSLMALPLPLSAVAVEVVLVPAPLVPALAAMTRE